jgi:hypothetical protein
MMTIFNLNRLARNLSENQVRETHKLFYLLVPLIVLVVSSSTAGPGRPSFSPDSNLWLINAVSQATILAGGLLWMWLINRQGDQKNFMERFICLSFPVQVYLQIAMLAIQWGLRGYLLALSEVTNGALLSVIFFNLFLAAHFAVLARWMKKTSHHLI